MGNRYNGEDFEVSKFLGNAVGAKNPFMRSIACMAEEEREICAYIEALKKITTLSPNKPSKEQTAILDKISEVIQVIGQGKFKQDIVTHLSMKATNTVRRSDAH